MIDLISSKAYTYDKETGKRSEIEFTDEMKEMVNQYKDAFYEAIAATSDELMESSSAVRRSPVRKRPLLCTRVSLPALLRPFTVALLPSPGA